MDDEKGIGAAVASMDPGGIRKAEQLALLPSSAMVGMVDDPAHAERKGAGRPAGSRNKRTQEWTDFILQRYPSPLVFLAETYSRPVVELATELSCKKEEAFRIQVAAAKEIAPFLHQKQPVAVEVDAKGVVQLVIEASPEVAAMVGQAADPGDGARVIEGKIMGDKESE